MRVIPLDQLRDKIPISVAVEAMERGFKALATGQAVLPEPLVGKLLLYDALGARFDTIRYKSS